MFLKRIEIQGFKSFADRVVINFDNSVTGIVGPNGCGKSNIADAIRWVLGEQSIKSLRGEKMTDVIFAGSENRKAQNMAEVSLVFDNSNHFLNSDLEEIEITRRIYNTEQDAEYLINKKNVRLKDVIDLILDTGLGKDSLSMISQGNISSFAEAKPYERRAIFEEAAGVSKYKKRKIESINHLERTKLNLERTQDILSELEKQVGPLRRQAKKAELYKEKKDRLQEIEIAVLVDNILYYQDAKKRLEKEIFDLENNITLHDGTIQIQENSNNESKVELRALDREINELQDNHFKVVNEIQTLEKRKIEIEEKQKYKIEIGNEKEKLEAIEQLLSDAEYEYKDRYNRLESLNSQLELDKHELEDVALKLTDASFKKEETSAFLRRLENRMEVLNNLLKDPFSSRSALGVKSIMDNRMSLPGILGVIGQELHPNKDFEQAISTALASSTFHIVTKNEESARNAITFLRKNQSGKATFLPLTVLKERTLNREHEIICNSAKGYLGTADQFVSCGYEYNMVVRSLLGNVIVCDNLENANNLSTLLKHSYKIVTLDGDVIHKGGSMTGGYIKNETSIITASRELEQIKEQIFSYKAKQELVIKEYNDLMNRKEIIERELTEKRISIAQLEPVVDAKRSKFEKLKNDHDALIPKVDKKSENQSNQFFDSLVSKLSDAYLRRDQASNNLKLKRDLRLKLSNEIERKEQQIHQLRTKVNEFNYNLRKISAEDGAVKAKLEGDLNRLASEYQMTFEYAKEHYQMELGNNAKDEVNELRNEISSLGSVNMNAPEEYAEVSSRYEFMKKNYDDLVASRDKILSAIEEMDDIMKKQFLDTFNLINGELNTTFKALFGGGKAKLVLEDENDILNTGIDIDVQPPGKSVKSIRLFSGGEKTLIAICVLFTILKIRPVPLIVFDEVEAALDQANVERFAKYVKSFDKESQFIIITHRPGTMAQCDVLYGVTMQNRGVSQMLKVKLIDAIEMAEKEDDNGLS